MFFMGSMVVFGIVSFLVCVMGDVMLLGGIVVVLICELLFIEFECGI